MSIAAKKIVDEVLLLPTDARVNLVEQLLTSLNLPTQPEVDRLWSWADFESPNEEKLSGNQFPP